MSERTPVRLVWRHDGDECEAVVGKQSRWAPVDRKTGRRRRSWSTGRTVIAIDDGPPCWRVTLDPSERYDGWNNPIYCGDQVVVEYEEK
jgi:hypothetical protein